jgi:hypothetical protein
VLTNSVNFCQLLLLSCQLLVVNCNQMLDFTCCQLLSTAVKCCPLLSTAATKLPLAATRCQNCVTCLPMPLLHVTACCQRLSTDVNGCHLGLSDCCHLLSLAVNCSLVQQLIHVTCCHLLSNVVVTCGQLCYCCYFHVICCRLQSNAARLLSTANIYFLSHLLSKAVKGCNVCSKAVICLQKLSK